MCCSNVRLRDPEYAHRNVRRPLLRVRSTRSDAFHKSDVTHQGVPSEAVFTQARSVLAPEETWIDEVELSCGQIGAENEEAAKPAEIQRAADRDVQSMVEGSARAGRSPGRASSKFSAIPPAAREVHKETS